METQLVRFVIVKLCFGDQLLPKLEKLLDQILGMTQGTTQILFLFLFI